MLKKSKSIYFIKRLFTFVEEKDKLNIFNLLNLFFSSNNKRFNHKDINIFFIFK